MNNDHELAKKNFLRLFPNSFGDESYIARERSYKVKSHQVWAEELGREVYQDLINSERYEEIALRLLKVYRGLNLLGTFEAMSLHDALKTDVGARLIGTAVFDSVYGNLPADTRFNVLSNAIAAVPMARGKLTTWPLQTVFPFLANPSENLFLKPVATRKAAERFGFDLHYRTPPNWPTYARLLEFGKQLMKDLESWNPADLIDIQGFIWVTTSSGYAEELI
jgi:hypothetical protein